MQYSLQISWREPNNTPTLTSKSPATNWSNRLMSCNLQSRIGLRLGHLASYCRPRVSTERVWAEKFTEWG